MNAAKYLEIQDGWTNVLAGLGGSRDKAAHTRAKYHQFLQPGELTDLWLSDGLGKKCVKVVADDMTRAGFTIKGDEDDVILDKMRELGIPALLNEACYWSGNFGGGLLVMDIEDGGDLEEPVSSSGGELVGLRLYDKFQVTIHTQDLYDDESPLDGEPEYFTVHPNDERGTGEFRVHRDRCAWIKGETVPKNSYARTDINDRFWGVSVHQEKLDDIKNAGTANSVLPNLLLEFTIGKLKVGNLGEILMENNAKAMYQRMEVVNVQKSVIHAIILGENEDFGRDTITLTNVPEVTDRIYTRVAATYQIPRTKLLEEQQAGLSNNDSVSLNNYYTRIESEQKLKLADPVSRVAAVINATEQQSEVDEKPIIEFNPVWEPTADEIASSMLKWAQAMKIFIELGVLDPREVRKSAFGSGKTKFQITLDESVDEEAMQATASAMQRAHSAAGGEQEPEE